MTEDKRKLIQTTYQKFMRLDDGSQNYILGVMQGIQMERNRTAASNANKAIS